MNQVFQTLFVTETRNESEHREQNSHNPVVYQIGIKEIEQFQPDKTLSKYHPLNQNLSSNRVRSNSSSD